MIYLVFFSSFFPPSIFSMALLALAAVKLAHRGVRHSARLPKSLLLPVSVWFLFAALALIGPVFIYHRSDHAVEAFKFWFAGVALFLGAIEGLEGGKIGPAMTLLVSALTLTYGGEYFFGSFVSQDAPLYPPDNNHSAAMLAVFLPVIVLRMRGLSRLLLLLLMVAFAFFVTSRALLAMTVLALAISPQNVRDRKALLVVAAPLSLALLFYSGLSLDNFSDQLRLQILQVSYGYAIGRGFFPFNFGEAAFTDFLNIYPIYRRLEIQHAHNLILQIWVAYGLVPLAVFSAWLLLMVRQAWADRNALLLAMIGVLLAFGMIEAIITDIRAFGVILFMLGYAHTSSRTAAAPLEAPTFAPSTLAQTPVQTEA